MVCLAMARGLGLPLGEYIQWLARCFKVTTLQSNSGLLAPAQFRLSLIYSATLPVLAWFVVLSRADIMSVRVVLPVDFKAETAVDSPVPINFLYYGCNG